MRRGAGGGCCPAPIPPSAGAGLYRAARVGPPRDCNAARPLPAPRARAAPAGRDRACGGPLCRLARRRRPAATARRALLMKKKPPENTPKKKQEKITGEKQKQTEKNGNLSFMKKKKFPPRGFFPSIFRSLFLWYFYVIYFCRAAAALVCPSHPISLSLLHTHTHTRTHARWHVDLGACGCGCGAERDGAVDMNPASTSVSPSSPLDPSRPVAGHRH